MKKGEYEERSIVKARKGRSIAQFNLAEIIAISIALFTGASVEASDFSLTTTAMWKIGGTLRRTLQAGWIL